MLIRPRYFTMEFKFLLGRALKPDPSASHRFLRRRKRVSYRGQNWPLGRALRGHRPTKQPVENGSALLLDSNSSPFWTDDVTCQKTTKLDQTELSEGQICFTTKSDVEEVRRQYCNRMLPSTANRIRHIFLSRCRFTLAVN